MMPDIIRFSFPFLDNVKIAILSDMMTMINKDKIKASKEFPLSQTSPKKTSLSTRSVPYFNAFDTYRSSNIEQINQF